MEIKITSTNGVLTTSSTQVAKDFEKEHKNVIQTINNLTAENSAVKNMFIEATYINDRGRQYKYYEITRDGFSLLVMGFTGKKALEWKLKYIEAFNKMEQAIKSSFVKKPDSYMIEDKKCSPFKPTENITDIHSFIALLISSTTKLFKLLPCFLANS